MGRRPRRPATGCSGWPPRPARPRPPQRLRPRRAALGRARRSSSGHSCVLSWWRAVQGEPAPAGVGALPDRGGAGAAAPPTSWSRRPPAMLAALRRALRPACRGSRVIPNGRDAAAFPPGAKEPLVLAAGRLWDEAKNIAALARVAPRAALAGLRRRRRRRHPTGARAGLDGSSCSAGSRPRELAGWYAPGVDLRPAGPLRALRALGPRGGPGRLRAGARRHPEPARGLGRRGAVRPARRRPRTSRRRSGVDRRPGRRADLAGRGAGPGAGVSRRAGWPRPTWRPIARPSPTPRSPPVGLGPTPRVETCRG